MRVITVLEIRKLFHWAFVLQLLLIRCFKMSFINVHWLVIPQDCDFALVRIIYMAERKPAQIGASCKYTEIPGKASYPV